MVDLGLVGRDKELGGLLSSIRERQNLHIHGPAGGGKSALLNRAYDNWREMDCALIPVYCRSSRTLREMGHEMATAILTMFIITIGSTAADYKNTVEKTRELANEIKKLIAE